MTAGPTNNQCYGPTKCSLWDGIGRNVDLSSAETFSYQALDTECIYQCKNKNMENITHILNSLCLPQRLRLCLWRTESGVIALEELFEILERLQLFKSQSQFKEELDKNHCISVSAKTHNEGRQTRKKELCFSAYMYQCTMVIIVVCAETARVHACMDVS